MTSRRGSVRLRTTLTATLVVGLALVAGGLLLLHLLTGSLTASAERAAGVRAAELVALLGRDISPGDLPLESDTSAFVQVLDRTGAVVAASADVAGQAPLGRDDAGTGSGGAVRLDPGPIGDREPFVAVTRSGPDGRWTVVAGRSLEPVSDSAEVLTTGLLAGVPLLTLLVAVTTWVLTGRALRPVELIRAEVAAITTSAPDRRVPVPAGGDEIGRLAVTMNAMLDRLEAAHTTQRRFLADASHELRNPLASLRSQLEVALAHPDRTTVPELAGDLHTDSVRLADLVEDLLLLARADEGSPGPPVRPVDLDDLVLAEAGRLQRTLAVRAPSPGDAAAGAVTVDLRGVGPARVLGDAAALTRLVRNLLDNAARHARHQVSVHLRIDHGRAVLEVSDDGRGIAPADRERVFDRFTRLDAARTRDAGGTGLGLTLVREVARAHGGTARVAPATDELPGCRLVVDLPLAP